MNRHIVSRYYIGGGLSKQGNGTSTTPAAPATATTTPEVNTTSTPGQPVVSKPTAPDPKSPAFKTWQRDQRISRGEGTWWDSATAAYDKSPAFWNGLGIVGGAGALGGIGGGLLSDKDGGFNWGGALGLGAMAGAAYLGYNYMPQIKNWFSEIGKIPTNINNTLTSVQQTANTANQQLTNVGNQVGQTVEGINNIVSTTNNWATNPVGEAGNAVRRTFGMSAAKPGAPINMDFVRNEHARLKAQGLPPQQIRQHLISNYKING